MAGPGQLPPTGRKDSAIAPGPPPFSESTKPGNRCGKCTACCTALGVPAIDKPPRHRCKHLCAKGCGIYPTRPEPCRVWSCGWLLGGDWLARYRPDRCGVIFHTPALVSDALVVNEVWPNAAQGADAKKLISLLVGLLADGHVLWTKVALLRFSGEVIQVYPKKESE
jgi:hypothetical protein